jgi:hypothetical protein
LHHGASYGHRGVVEALIHNPAVDIHAKTSEGETALSLAKAKKFDKIAKLIEGKADMLLQLRYLEEINLRAHKQAEEDKNAGLLCFKCSYKFRVLSKVF